MTFVANSPAGSFSAPPFIGAGAEREPLRLLAACPPYHPTPLHRLPGLAARLGIGALMVKDETARLGLGSFKALGGVYAVATLFAEHAERTLGPLAPADYVSPRVKSVAGDLTACCASDGNHGRAVAAGARLFGGASVVYLPAIVSAERAARIAMFGARVVRVAGGYDDAVATAARDAEANGWMLVADTAPAGETRACALVMQGYTVLVHEVLDALAPGAVTHVFLQAGVGGLASAFMGHWTARRDDGTQFIVVEPDSAACCLESARQGRLARIPPGDTVMAMLECGEPSPLAWPILAAYSSAFMAVPDAAARAAVRALARPESGDPSLEVGESGAAGLAGLLHALPRHADALGLTGASHVLVIATECPSDRPTWQASVANDD
ncbi:MAG: diaminopropionate ammonia-lyase [Acetobacteraceae bacterium]